MSMNGQGLTEKPRRGLADNAGPSFVYRGYFTVVPSLNGHRTPFVSRRERCLLGLGQTHLLGPSAHLRPAKTRI